MTAHTLISTHYLPWLSEIDRRIGRAARVDLGGHFSFLDAWIAGNTPQEALQLAIEDFEARQEAGNDQLAS